MTEQSIIQTRCKQGKLIITDQYIRVQLFNLKQESMARGALTGIDSKMVTPTFFGWGGATDMVFHGGGIRLEAGLVPTGDAKKIKELLGY